MDELIFDKYFNSSLKFLSYRSRSEKEVRDNLIKKKAPQDLIEKIVERLKEHKFLDDKEFAIRFVEQRILSKPKAARVLKMELRQKGVSADIIENIEMGDELEHAKKLLDKKVERYKSLDRDEIYKKMGSFLAGRGFDWETIKKAIDESFSKVV